MANEAELIEHARHCIGLDRKKPYKRHGRLWYKPYRNYFCTYTFDEIWQELARLGYAEHGSERNGDYGPTCAYWLTRAGLDWLGRELGIMIHDEEE